ncbi:N-formylglutamate amidohydrolase [Henriciella aquimarina]|uniref:N-formylglutamate amidohydrolase n=1 Tax=Henriciella aquimarina TaxID=545261 RepID=UPI000A02929D|nr:N-formylglutamate amidohydrolase [Henriciella aquimarina]
MSLADREQETSDRPDGPVPAFAFARPAGVKTPVLFTSPHSGTHYPDTLLQNLRVPLIDLRRTEDAHVDALFAHAPNLGAALLRATHARAFVDLNRDPRELDPDMFTGKLPGKAAAPSVRVQAGLGCIPKIGARGDTIYAKKLSPEDGESRLSGVHAPYHQALSGEIAALHQKFGCVFLIDCHSMPSKQPGRPDLPDIVLGDRFGSSCTSQLTNLVERTFRQAGLTVTRNAPYAGGYTTRRYGRPKRHVHALQIEINRRLYMDEVTVEPLPDMAGLSETIDLVIAEICRLAVRLSP